MRNKEFLLFFVAVLSLNQTFSMMAQNISTGNSEKQMVQYFIISVGFYSIGQGINQKSQDELFEYINKEQKKFKSVIFYERIQWGKEGEETIYLDLENLPVSERQEFLHNLSTMFRNRSKMAIVQANLYYEPDQHYLTLGVMLNGQNSLRENSVLKSIEKYEKKYNLKINTGSMINETGIVEDQDKRYQLNLSGLTENQLTEIVNETKNLMKPALPAILEVDFRGIGGANDRAYKSYLSAFINKFELENKLKIRFESRIYEMNGGGALFTIYLNNLPDLLKIQIVNKVNNMYAETNYISLAYY